MEKNAIPGKVSHSWSHEITYGILSGEKNVRRWGFSSVLSNKLVELYVLILRLLLRDLGNGFHFMIPVISTDLSFSSVTHLHCRLPSLVSVLSPSSVVIGHCSSRKHTINPNTITKSRLQKRKIIAPDIFLSFIPKGSRLKYFLSPPAKPML